MRMPATIKPQPFAARHRRAAVTRETILQAAADMFARGGLAGARTDAIAQAAQVNKALLYYYFKSKDGLYNAVLEDHLVEFSRRAIEALAAGSPRSALLRFVSMHFDFISTRPYYPVLLHRVMMSDDKLRRRLVRKYFQPVRRRVVAMIERGIRNGEFRRVDSEHAAISVAGITVFYFVSAPVTRLVGGFNPYAPEHLARRKQEVLDFVRYALFRSPEAPLP